MATEQKLLTAEELWELPDDGLRRELLDGVLVEMSPTGRKHARSMSKMARVLGAHADETGSGEVYCGDLGILLRRNPDRVRAPDVCFISNERLEGANEDGYIEVVPEFVIEIVSPGDRASEVQAKIEEWLRAGAVLVWAAYPRTRSIHAFRGGSETRVYGPAETIGAAPVLPEFSVRVADLFE